MNPAGNTLKREVELVSAKAKRAFQPAELRRVLRLAGWYAGMLFVDDFLPQRWNPLYALRAGYTGKGGRDKIPYFERGDWVKNAQRAAPRSIVTGERLRLRIPVPIGHALTPTTARDFIKVTDVERNAVAQAFASAAADIINRGSSKRTTIARLVMPGAKRKAVVKGWTKRISDQDRALTKAISRGGFRAGRVATELQTRAGNLAFEHRSTVKARLTPGQLKKVHQGWRRQAGGAAGPTASQELSGQVRSKTYAGSRLERHAQAQARYRAKYRQHSNAIGNAQRAADAFISSSL